MVSPLHFFILSLLITILAVFVQRLVRWRDRRALQALARQWGMHYAPDDRFRIADAVAQRFPVPGASDVRVRDLIYGNQQNADGTGEGRRYLFTAEFTIGVIHTKKRRRRVLTFKEPKDRRRKDELPAMEMAPAELSRVAQYQHLVRKNPNDETRMTNE